MGYAIRLGARPVFPDWILELPSDLVAIGGDLEPTTLVEAYRKGIFPWNGDDPIRWYSPNPRMILQPERVRVSRSLQKRIRKGTYEIRYDRNFRATMEACMQMSRPGQDGTWITPRMVDAYEQLFHIGIAHSVEAYEAERLVGGLYGLAMGNAFFGESMFARRPDASKCALVQLCRDYEDLDFIDCQQETEHLARFGASAIPRGLYRVRLAQALNAPDRFQRPPLSASRSSR